MERIWLLAIGVHVLTKPMALGPADSGASAANPVTYQGLPAADGTPAVLTAGVPVPSSSFGPCPSADHGLALPNDVVCADLKKLGMTDFGDFSAGTLKDCQNNKTEVFFAAQPMVLARWPNTMTNGSYTWAHVAAPATGGFTYNTSEGCPAAAHRWAAAPDAWTHG